MPIRTWREACTRVAAMMRLAILSTALAACAGGVPEGADDPEGMAPGSGDFGKEDGPGNGWTSVGNGVEYLQVNSGGAIIIAYGGYSAQMSYSAAWAQELVDAKLGAAGVGKIYAVKGPQDPGYDAKEIGNSKLRKHLPTIDDGTSPIYVVAHSSGSYVADELFDQLETAGSSAILSRIAYADLDGGGGLTSAIIDQMRAVEFVYAHDPSLSSGYSENNSTAKALAEDYAPKSTAFEVTVSHTGCDNGAGWCLHDVLITHRPHNPDHYDLAHDYTDFVNRPVTDEYLDPLIPPAM
jgi:hypothetical protein